jgi:hypothetical protein
LQFEQLVLGFLRKQAQTGSPPKREDIDGLRVGSILESDGHDASDFNSIASKSFENQGLCLVFIAAGLSDLSCALFKITFVLAN